MYSTMMTPVCTETPNSANMPMPDDTLRYVPVTTKASRPPMRSQTDIHHNQR